MASPLEQFDLIRLLPLRLFGNDLSLFTLVLPLSLLLLGLLLGVAFFTINSTLLPTSWQQSWELLYAFVAGVLREQAGVKGVVYVPLFLSLFLAILGANLLSLMPFGIAITSHVVITLFLSFSLILSLFLLGFVTHNLTFLKLFLPHCPFPLLFLLVPIEIFSYFVRCFSLAIRLSANILAGHTLVLIVSGFIVPLVQLRA